jgi:ribosomal protein S18 acetylase RimI-like enzyme
LRVVLVLTVCNPGVVRTYTPNRDIDIDGCISSVLPLIHEAGNPYFDWLFGDPEVVQSVLASRMRSPESEISIRDTVVLVGDGGRDVIGVFIALAGAELWARRKADAVAYLKHVGRSGRARLLRHLQESRDLFASVRADEFYLSKLGVQADARGCGHGRALVERFVSMGAARGLTRFVLDVSDGNAPALALYESMGFQIARASGVRGGCMRYVSMRLDVGPTA